MDVVIILISFSLLVAAVSYLIGAMYAIGYTCYSEFCWWFIVRPKAVRIDRVRNEKDLRERLKKQKAKKNKLHMG